jgi:hypothetical protein
MVDKTDFAQGQKAIRNPGKDRVDGSDKVGDGTATPVEPKTPSNPSNPSNP